MQKVVEYLKSKGLNKEIKTIVGGAPLSDEFAREIGADAYAFDASNAVVRVGELIGA
jgi:methanogenic corrinoid protein MtbC1